MIFRYEYWKQATINDKFNLKTNINLTYYQTIFFYLKTTIFLGGFGFYDIKILILRYYLNLRKI